ncbi:restriction endonuclease subunit M [Embleya scabrispora]|uniref:site-specific DNA-methyltransferase (adenine-specific) n=1 Tax=Embleya scabrispora TaxID=159449 RepID=A0A1T3NIB6_9ACTN|nr:type I restriction-modification system subunit M [Embleya scabrispora]OPC76455.1 restriction endonuclease subunit M [Embleya scabrispora]
MPSRKRAGERDVPDLLWQAVSRLRGSMDTARYKHYVLGLLFLRHAWAAFTERRDEIARELADLPAATLQTFLESPDEYTSEGVLWIPPVARWDAVTAHARAGEGELGTLLDGATQALARQHRDLHDVLPRIYDRALVDPVLLRNLVDVLDRPGLTGHPGRRESEILRELYEALIERFAREEGKRGADFHTPSSVTELVVQLLEPYGGRIHDPCCGTGGFLIKAGRFLEAHRGREHRDDIVVSGQEINQTTWRLARMNLSLSGMDGAGAGARWADTLAEDLLPDLDADFVMSHPPFNTRNWARRQDDPRWTFGVPPRTNANFAWLQHACAKLAPTGTAAVVLANGSLSTKQSGEGAIRAAMIDQDLVACLIALPERLFPSTAIPACVWILAKDKSPQGASKLTDRRGQVLFVDASRHGSLIDRAQRAFADDEIAAIADIYRAWRGTRSARASNTVYEDVAGLCRSVPLTEIRGCGHVLTPGRYVEVTPLETAPDDAHIARLTHDFLALLDKADNLASDLQQELRNTANGLPWTSTP